MLTLGIDTPWLWSDPLGEETLATLLHEVAHHLNAHHGRDFHQEVENLAGRAAKVMFDQGITSGSSSSACSESNHRAVAYGTLRIESVASEDESVSVPVPPSIVSTPVVLSLA